MSLIEDFKASQKAPDEFEACRRAVGRHFADVQDSEVDLHRLARERGITITECENAPFEGMIERDGNGGALILLRRGLNRRRQRFTLAHELGHWVLQEEMVGTMVGKLFRGVSRNEREVREEERLASLIAAEILMPVNSLAAVVGTDCSFESVRKICRLFGVSRMAAIRRIADVLNTNILFVQLVPFRFNNLRSLAQVDDALFVTARKATLFARDSTKLVRRFPFNDLATNKCLRISLDSPKGSITDDFEIDMRGDPVPHAFALASGMVWE